MDVIADIVLDQGKTLCTGQLSHVLQMHVQQCKQLLAQFLSDHRSEVDGIYTWIEESRVENTKEIVMLVSTEELDGRKHTMEHGAPGKKLISCDIYALYPKKTPEGQHPSDDKEKMYHTLWSHKRNVPSQASKENGKWNGVWNQEIELREQVNRSVGVQSTSLFDRKETKRPFFQASGANISKKKAQTTSRASPARVAPKKKVLPEQHSRLRKNQIMDDSSSDEDDPFADVDEDECNPEIPQNRPSSKAENDRKTTSGAISPPSPPQQEHTESASAHVAPSGSSTKQVLQTRQRINSEGYMVTEKIWVEEAEHGESRKEDQVQSTSTLNDPSSKKLLAKKKRKAPTPKVKHGKVQQSLTSFFTKK